MSATTGGASWRSRPSSVSVSSNAAWATPTARAAMLIRPASRPPITCLKPRPSMPPTRLAAGTTHSSNTSSAVSTPLYPSLATDFVTRNPGCPFSTMKQDIPRWRGSARGSVSASSASVLPSRAFVMNILLPLTI